MPVRAARPLLIILVLLLCPAPGQARALFPASEFKLGVEGNYTFYDEPGVMHEEGQLKGLFGSWTGYFTDSLLMAALELDYTEGNLEYRARPDHLKFHTDNTFAEGRLLFGRGFAFDKVAVTPFTGIGLRNWYNKMRYPSGFDRHILQLYLPVGVKLLRRIDETWSVGGTLEGDMLLKGRVKSKLSNLPGHQDSVNTQALGHGWGLQVSAFTEYDFGKFSLGAEPYLRYWHVEQSDEVYGLYGGVPIRTMEPENTFYISGLKLYVKF